MDFAKELLMMSPFDKERALAWMNCDIGARIRATQHYLVAAHFAVAVAFSVALWQNEPRLYVASLVVWFCIILLLKMKLRTLTIIELLQAYFNEANQECPASSK